MSSNMRIYSGISEKVKNIWIFTATQVLQALTWLVTCLPEYWTVQYNPNGIANTLFLAKMQERGCYYIKYDSKDGNEFIIYKPDRSMRVFKQSDRGLYFMDSKMASTTEVTLVNTVDNNRSN